MRIENFFGTTHKEQLISSIAVAAGIILAISASFALLNGYFPIIGSIVSPLTANNISILGAASIVTPLIWNYINMLKNELANAQRRIGELQIAVPPPGYEEV